MVCKLWVLLILLWQRNSQKWILVHFKENCQHIKCQKWHSHHTACGLTPFSVRHEVVIMACWPTPFSVSHGVVIMACWLTPFSVGHGVVITWYACLSHSMSDIRWSSHSMLANPVQCQTLGSHHMVCWLTPFSVRHWVVITQYSG